MRHNPQQVKALASMNCGVTQLRSEAKGKHCRGGWPGREEVLGTLHTQMGKELSWGTDISCSGHTE